MVDRPWIIYTQCEQCVIIANIMLSLEQAAMNIDILHIGLTGLGKADGHGEARGNVKVLLGEIDCPLGS